jgi:tetratricopeptide (TPR) repeat protein
MRATLHEALALIGTVARQRSAESAGDASRPRRQFAQRAAVLIRLGQLDAAAESLNAALALLAQTLPANNPRTAVHRDSLAEIDILSGDYDAASSRLRALIDELGEAPATLRQRLVSMRKLAMAERGAKRWDEAITAAQQAIDLAIGAERPGEQALALLLEALIELDRQQPERAAERFNAALKLLPDCALGPCVLDQGSSHLLRSQYLARIGATDAALDTLQYAIEHRRWSASILSHPDLDALRAHPRWSQLVSALNARIASETDAG